MAKNHGLDCNGKRDSKSGVAATAHQMMLQVSAKQECFAKCGRGPDEKNHPYSKVVLPRGFTTSMDKGRAVKPSSPFFLAQWTTACRGREFAYARSFDAVSAR